MNSCCTITRYYGHNDENLEQLWRFIEQAQTYSNRILIGVNVEKDLTNCIEKYLQRGTLSNIPVDFVPIQPWIGISSPLNILLNHLPSNETITLIQSIEIQCQLDHVKLLHKYIREENILCVGYVLDGHQIIKTKSNKITLRLQGDTSPWNTFAMWNLAKLRRTGFPMCSDYINPPGMEDASAIALQQKLFGGMKQNRALLIYYNEDIHWLNKFEYDRERQAKHEIKMKSKNDRTKQLLQMLNISDYDQLNEIGIEYINNDLSM